MEVFKEIKEFKPTRYKKQIFISNFGRIKKINQKDIELFTYGSNQGEYKEISINGKNIPVHRLVGKYFVNNPKPNEYLEIDHIDRNPSNNHFSNIRWCNRSINNRNRIFKKYGYINETKYNTYQFTYYINKIRKTKTFKTEKEAKIAQRWYRLLINHLES